MSKEITGIIPAVITPLTASRELDTELLAIQAAYLSRAGANGFFVAGTIAEGGYLATEEKRQAFTTIQKASGGTKVLCLACIRPSTEQVIAEIKALEDLNPDYVAAVTPFYGRASQSAIYNHYKAIADTSKTPLLLYNIPSYTHSFIELETIEALSRHENIVGIKDSSGDFVSFSRGLTARAAGRGTPEDFKWIMGKDYLDAAALSLGCDALVNGLCNVRIEPYSSIVTMAAEGDWKGVLSQQYEINRLYDVIRTCKADLLLTVKAGAAFYGRCREVMKMEGAPLSPAEKERLEEALKQYD